ncbi:MAG: cytochrome c oxidase assembly protein [Solirubrobacteraceae bacterium]|nr:cytochrome c oxidase assembly protein [Solirubrobacteraceae bacterium]
MSPVPILGATPDASWNLEPVVILMLAAVAFLYTRRWWQVRASVGRLLSFWLGLACFFAALISPIDALAEQLFTMHMIQHLLLIDLGVIFCLLGLTRVILRPLTKRTLRLERAAGPFATPVFALLLYVATMWIWHIPALYDAALQHPLVHRLEHITFITAGSLYWWHLISPIRSRHRLGGMGPAAYMASTKVMVGLLGVGLAFAPEAIYGFYEAQPSYWGMDAHTDQSVAGLVMATEQSIVMGIALAYLFIKALEESEKEEQRRERYGDVAESSPPLGGRG